MRGKTVVITGASSGIGLVTAQKAASAGARVVLAARNEGDLRQAVDDIRARDVRVRILEQFPASPLVVLAAALRLALPRCGPCRCGRRRAPRDGGREEGLVGTDLLGRRRGLGEDAHPPQSDRAQRGRISQGAAQNAR